MGGDIWVAAPSGRSRVCPWLVARGALTPVKGALSALPTGFGNGENLPTLLEAAGLSLVVSVCEHTN